MLCRTVDAYAIDCTRRRLSLASTIGLHLNASHLRVVMSNRFFVDISRLAFIHDAHLFEEKLPSGRLRILAHIHASTRIARAKFR